MASNPYVNKVIYGNTTVIDLTSDTVASNKLASGFTAHDKSGAPITGNASLKLKSEVIGNTLYFYDTDLYSVSGTALMVGNKVSTDTFVVDF